MSKNKKPKTYRIPGLITYVPFSVNDVLTASFVTWQFLKCFGGVADGMSEVIPENDYFTAVKEGLAWSELKFNHMFQLTLAGMCTSGLIDFLAPKRRSRHKKEISEKLGVKRGTVDEETRKKKIQDLCWMIKADYTTKDYTMKEESKIANETLEELVYKIEGVRIKTSHTVKKNYLMKYIMPYALGANNLITGEIDIFKQLPYHSFSIIAHELAHRKYYLRENDAEVLAHLTGLATKNPTFIQSSRFSRLIREYQSLFPKYPKNKFSNEERKDFLLGLNLPIKMKTWLIQADLARVHPVYKALIKAQLFIYKGVMKLKGDKEGILGYTKVFTEDMHALENSYGSAEKLVEYLKNKEI